jgi:hypothetical protein
VQRPTTATSRRALGRMRTRAAAKSAQVITAADAAPADAAATAADTAADTADAATAAAAAADDASDDAALSALPPPPLPPRDMAPSPDANASAISTAPPLPPPLSSSPLTPRIIEIAFWWWCFCCCSWFWFWLFSAMRRRRADMAAPWHSAAMSAPTTQWHKLHLKKQNFETGISLHRLEG